MTDIKMQMKDKIEKQKEMLKIAGAILGRRYTDQKKPEIDGSSVSDIKKEFSVVTPDDLKFRRINSEAVSELLAVLGFKFPTKQVLDSMLTSAIYTFPVDNFIGTMSSDSRGTKDEGAEIQRTTLYIYGLICLVEDKEAEIKSMKIE